MGYGIAMPRRAPRSPRPAPSAPLSALLLAAASAVAAACSEPPPAPTYRDLVVEGALVSSLPGGDPEQLPCGFERRFARTVRAGEVLTAEVDLGVLPFLGVTACRRRADLDAETADAGELAVTVTGEGGAVVEGSWPITGETGWRRRSIDLQALAGRRATLRIEARFDGPRRLFLEEVTIEHLTPAPERPAPPPPQVLLISADTLRADSIARLGDPGGSALARLAAQGERFERHYAGASWTKPSHADLLTGYGAGVHGVLGFEDPIDPSVPTLAERFRAAGFATAGLVHDCVWLDPKFGFDRGFESYRSVPWGFAQEMRAASNWMAAHRDRPFFYFLHLFEPHSDFDVLPYEAPGSDHDEVERRFGVPAYGCREGACASELLAAINEGTIEPLPGEAEILRFLYDRGVERVDSMLFRLFANLEAAGLFEDLLIVVTSDHGEAFLEHGLVNHGTSWEEVMRVPLIVKWPRDERAGTVRETPTASIDVAVTLLAAAGIEAGDLPGADLRTRRDDRPVFAGTYERVVVAGTLKGIFPSPGDGPARLYDLAADPGERRDLAVERPEDLARLRRLLDAQTAADLRERERLAAAAGRRERDAARPALTPEERARLRALGYAGE